MPYPDDVPLYLVLYLVIANDEEERLNEYVEKRMNGIERGI